MKVIFDDSEEINAKEIIKGKKVKKFGAGGGHIIVSKQFVNKKATIIIHAPTGSYIEAIRKFTKKGKK